MNNINFINPVPPKQQIQISIFIKIFITVIILFFIGLYIIFQKKQKFEKTKKLIMEKAEIAKKLLEDKKDLEKEKNLLEEKIEKIKILENKTQDLYIFLEKLFNSVPSKIALTKVEFLEKNIKIIGSSKNIESIKNFLEDNPDFKLISISTEKGLFIFNIFKQENF